MAAPLKTAASSAGAFVPRAFFEVSSHITRSYFLGHHTAALASMRKVLSNIGLIIECRDSRVPLTSANPLLESALAGARPHYRVHEDRPLRAGDQEAQGVAQILAHAPDSDGPRRGAGLAHRLARPRRACRMRGSRTLLNALRRDGMQLPKAARTSGLPGTTRKLSMPVRIVAATPSPSSSDISNSDSPPGHETDVGEGVFVVDTPGVFVPYVADVESMLKLALVGCVKDGLVPAETVADYLLFLLNLRDPSIYAHLCNTPTNDIYEFLDAVARRTGKLLKGGVPSRTQAAPWIIQQWRAGHLGHFILDNLTKEALDERARRIREQGENTPLSMNQARKRMKEALKEKNAAKRAAALNSGA
ncbi:hypothetical protein CHU98_g659 [Xylaria longipes]|nr:hypothetical protein CHU98_g659 [Xylaria longipes]